MADEIRLLKLDQVADLLQVSESTVRRLVTRGQLRVIKIGGSLRFRYEDVLAMLEEAS